MLSIKVEGMSCDHCVKRITKKLESLNYLRDILVSLEEGKVYFNILDDTKIKEVKEVINDLGYDVVDE